MATRYFTHYWKNKTWENESVKVSPYWWGKKSEGKIEHTAGNVFKDKGIKTGDVVYVITVKDGKLRVGGKIIVDKVLNQTQAAAYLKTTPDRLWDAKDHLVMSSREAKYFTPLNKVKTATVKKLLFKSTSNIRPVKFYPNGSIHEQTLRGVCELTEASAKLVDNELGNGDKYPQW